MILMVLFKSGRGVMKRLHKFFALTFILFLVSCDEKNPSLLSLFSDLTAKQLLKAEKYEEALSLYLKLLESLPHEAKIHSNVGVLLDQQQKSEDAVKSLNLALQKAEENKDAAAAFAIHYNLGVHFGRLKMIPEALEHYQAALEINPTSIETKTNIELLIQLQNQNGQGESNEDKKDGENSENKDQKEGDSKDNKDQEDDKNNKGDSKDKKQPDKGSPKYKPRPFKGDQLSEGDVKKILGEMRNQEQKIRANFEKKESKESKNGKDW